MGKVLWLLALMMFCTGPAWAEPTGAPEELAVWKDWVLYGHEEQHLCPAGAGVSGPQCLWPVSLALELTDRGGRFTLTAESRAEKKLNLPGGPGAWPRSVTDEQGRKLPVMGKELPQVPVSAGRLTLTGLFDWKRLPDTLEIPAGYPLNLKINGRTIDFPALEPDPGRGSVRVWLRDGGRETASPEAETDGLTVTVNRLVQDQQPLRITTRLKLVVSGRPREVLLPQAWLPDTKVVSLSSPLPAQLTDQGLRVRVQPGIHEIFLDSRSLNRSESLGPTPADLSEPEFWAWEAFTDLRLAEVSGAEQIDPSQADLHGPWSRFPVYLIAPGGGLTFTTLRRGDPEPPPDRLNLARECWLDFNGRGLGCRDRLTGELNRQWHLNASPPFTLAQASLDGQPQVITWQTDSRGRPSPGLQLRRGRVNLEADLRLDDFQGRLPASGWDHDLETEGQKINLPPGYRLLHVSGAEARQSGPHSAPGSWTGAWGTLDFFLVLIVALAAGKLYGAVGGLTVLAALVLSYQEPLTPVLAFLPLLAAVALSRLTPPGSLAGRLIRITRLAAGLALAVLTIFFLVDQARTGLFPQLENPQAGYGRFTDGFSAPAAPVREFHRTAVPEAAAVEEAEAYYDAAPPNALRRPAQSASGGFKSRAVLSPSPAAPPRPAPKADSTGAPAMVLLNQAPDAKVQNSAPRPAWTWRSLRLYYNETVTAGQEVRLYLLGPAGGRLWGLARIALMALAVMIILGLTRPAGRPRGEAGPEAKSAGLPAAVGAALAVAAALVTVPAWASPEAEISPPENRAGPAAFAPARFPSPEMLETYRQRLLTRRPATVPGWPELTLKLASSGLTMTLAVEAEEETILALPSLDRDLFRPRKVSLEKGPELPLLEHQGRWLVLMPAGVNRLVVEGRLKAGIRAFQVNFTDLRPQRVAAETPGGWTLEGLEDDGRPLGGALYFLAPENAGPAGRPAGESPGEPGPGLEPFFEIERTVSLGLEWRIRTTVRRVTPTGSPVSLKYPLLEGESPVSGGLRADQGRVTINLGPRDSGLSWESSLEIRPELRLTAAEGPWTETWRLDASPIWRVGYDLTPIHNTSAGFWQPAWRPWPGEVLNLNVDRPQAVGGRYLVVDSGRLAATLGEKTQVNRLAFRVRASQGGPFSFELPPGAEVRQLTVDGRPAPLTGAGEPADPADPADRPVRLTAPLTVGEQEVEVHWRLNRPLSPIASTAPVNLKTPAANLTATLTLPENRWLIWTWGPLMGPAVQFWPLVLLTVPAAFLLGRVRRTPLSGPAWFLLGLGLVQFSVAGALVVAGWLLALGRRGEKAIEKPWLFNANQIFLAAWTLAALVLIYHSLEFGLMQTPDMRLAGGGSYGRELSWFLDRTEGPWPAGRALTAPMWLYKSLMLIWSLWLAASLIKWLKWGWLAFSEAGRWKKRPAKKPKPAGSEKKRGEE